MPFFHKKIHHGLHVDGAVSTGWGDLLHNHALQLPEPEVAAEFDEDSNTARNSRVEILPQLAERKVWIAGAHLPFPGLGHLRKESKGFSWVPVEYIPLEY